MLRVAVKLQIFLRTIGRLSTELRRSTSMPATVRASAVTASGPPRASSPRRRAPRLASPHAGPGGAGHRPRTRLLSEHAHTHAAPGDDTSRPGHVGAAPSFRRSSRTLPNSCTPRACAARPSRPVRRPPYMALRTAPVGGMPVRAYCQNAMSSLRATAIIPMRRARRPAPKRARYHCVSALLGCQRTQFHAS
jgi:hypothetical protein